jgi:hypothetical protein
MAQTHTLRSGWNLVGNDSGADINSVKVFGDASTPNAISAQVTSIWSWDSLNLRWNFYAPSMTGAELSTYAGSKGYGVLSAIPKGEGYWVNAKQPITYPIPATPTLEGAYEGTLAGWSPSNSFSLLVLENGDFWSMYGTTTSKGLAVAGFVQGSGTDNKSSKSYTSTNSKDFGYSPAVASSLSAIYNLDAKTITGALTAYQSVSLPVPPPTSTMYGSVQINAGPLTSSLYQYDTPASLTAVAGTWVATTFNGDTMVFVFSSIGTFSTTSTAGCKVSGTLVPRPSGKNVFNLDVTFGPAPCYLPNKKTTGIAISYPLPGGGSQFVAGVIDDTRTYGAAIVGTR